jgi:O-methyltransferase involved in polyketide biosynthesis
MYEAVHERSLTDAAPAEEHELRLIEWPSTSACTEILARYTFYGAFVEEAASACQGVSVKLAGGLDVTHRTEAGSEVAGGGEGVGVVLS